MDVIVVVKYLNCMVKTLINEKNHHINNIFYIAGTECHNFPMNFYCRLPV
jgi:hypothetical protein